MEHVFAKGSLRWLLTALGLGSVLGSVAMAAPAISEFPDVPEGVPAYSANSWSLAVLPDTQYYSSTFPGLFMAQTAWLRLNAEVLNVRYVLHLGDITDTNTPGEWQHAQAALSLLDSVVPVVLIPGNHDYGPGGNTTTRDTPLSEYFSFDKAAAQPGFGEAFEEGKLQNTYRLFEAGGVEWLIMTLEWAPRDEVIEWANRVMADHPERRGVLITHAYLNHDDTRLDHLSDGPGNYNPHDYGTPGSVNDGQELWDKLVRHHNFVLVLCGHILGDGTGYLVSTNGAGQPVHQILSNYQMGEMGGSGVLRLMEFRPDGIVQVRTYSPLYDGYLITPDQQFSFKLR